MGGLSTLGPMGLPLCRSSRHSWGGVCVGCSDREVQGMNRSLFRIVTYVQLGLTLLVATGCAPTQPFFLNEKPDLQYYLNAATEIEYPDVDVPSLPDTTETLRPLTVGNHEYEFWNLTLEEAVSVALGNAKFFVTTSGIAEQRQNVADQFISGSAEQFGSVYDVAIQQSTTQSVPLTVDSNGNRTLPRGVLRANQVGGVEDALAEFDAQASGFFSYSNTDRPRNAGDSAVTTSQFQSDDVTAQTAISKRMATGGVASLRHQLVYGRNNLPVGVGGAARQVPSDYTVTIEAQVQHPLMRNRGTMINRIPVVLASLNEDLSIAEYEIQVRNLVRDVEVAYWDLYVAYRNVATSIIGRNSAIVTAQFARLALENGTGTRQELAQAVEQYYQFRGLVESAIAGSNLPGADRFGVYGAERRLRELLGISPTDGRLIRPIDEPTLARVEYEWNDLVAQLLYLSPELRQTKTRIKQQELELISAKNQILPDVNLSWLYRWVGVGDTLGPPSGSDVDFPTPGSSALESITDGNYQEGAIRLEVTPTAIGARRELARIRGAKLRLARESAILQEKERLLVSRLSDAVAKASTHYQLVQTNAQRWQAAEQEVEARLAEFKGGRSPVNVVLQSQQRRAQAQIDYYRALSEYNKSLNYVDYLKGTMLANNHITLREGPWNKKAYWDALERARERSAGKQLQYGVTRPGVVRTGPLGDAATAEAVIGSGAATHGTHVPPGYEGDVGPLGIDLDPYRDPVEVDDQPLSEMGETPMELFSPAGPDGTGTMPQRERIPPGRPEAAPRSTPQPTPAPRLEEAPPIAPSADMQTRGGPTGGWGTARHRSPQVKPVAFNPATETYEHAPEPVRRRPVTP